jgi:hypothetical protein
VAAESEDDAIKQAKDLTDFVSLDKFGECYDTSTCVSYEEELTDERMDCVERTRLEMHGYPELSEGIRDEFNRISENEGYLTIDDMTSFAKDVLSDVINDDNYETFTEDFHDALRELVVNMGIKYSKKD